MNALAVMMVLPNLPIICYRGYKTILNWVSSGNIAEKTVWSVYIKYQDKSNSLSVLTQHISNGIRAIETSRIDKTEAENRLNNAK